MEINKKTKKLLDFLIEFSIIVESKIEEGYYVVI